MKIINDNTRSESTESRNGDQEYYNGICPQVLACSELCYYDAF